MEDSVFTKIINGDIPCHKIYEDTKTLAFLTISPIHPGHTLVVPKLQIDKLWDLPDEEYQALMATSKKIANHIQTVLRPKRVGCHVAGDEVAHAHIHLFPFEDGQDFWDRPLPPDAVSQEDLANMATRLRMGDER